jgi:two-component system, chemotaxis family, protein-glutamate methylesterase/glutaminase
MPPKVTSVSGCPPTTVLGIAAWAGGFRPLSHIVELLSFEVDLSVLIVMHISRDRPSHLAKLLSRVSNYDVTEALDGEPLETGHAYVAPPDHHLTVRNNLVQLTRGPTEHRVRPAADPLFRSIAHWYGPCSIGLVLSGTRTDGARGLAELHRRAGLALVQHPEEALFPPMPEAAIRANHPKVLRTPTEIVHAIEETARANVEEGRSRARTGGFHVMSNENIDGASEDGEVTALRCPDCGGSLWRHQESDGARDRCRVGHAPSMETLGEAQLDVLASTLGGAVAALEERADFPRRFRAETRQYTLGDRSDEIDEIEEQAEQLRALMTSVLSAGTASELG